MKYNIVKNKFNIDGCICNSKISKNELIMEFKIDDDCILNDFDKNFNHHFLLAVKLYINRDKTSFVKYINGVNKIVIEDSLLFMSDHYLNKIKNYFLYFMITQERSKFENEFLSYCNTYHNIKIDKELFKKFYIYCHSYAYTYSDIEGKDYAIICPARIFNFKISNKLPTLIHQIKDNIWRIFADKDYHVGEEIFECYYTMNVYKHPLLNFITLNDWKLSGYIKYCDMVDFNKNDEFDSKMKISKKLTVEDINNINKIYNIDYNELKQDLQKTSNHREYQILKLKIYEYKLINDAIKQNYIDYSKLENEKITTGIEIYDFSLSKDFCSELINLIDNSGQEVQMAIKKCISFSIFDKDFWKYYDNTNKYSTQKELNIKNNGIFLKLKNIIYEKFLEYCEKYKYFSSSIRMEKTGNLKNDITRNTDLVSINLTKYEPKIHDCNVFHSEDSFVTIEQSTRKMAFIIYLNDVNKGGKTEFYFQDFEIEPKLGRIAFFPPNWLCTHKGNVSLDENKYILTGWIHSKVLVNGESLLPFYKIKYEHNDIKE